MTNKSNPIVYAGVAVALLLLSISAAWFCYAHGYTLYFGDAEAHLNIARRLLDSRTPGPEQLGTVWLPLPPLLTAPFAVNDFLWRSGLAGVIPSAACFVIAGMFLFASAKRVYGGVQAGLLAALFFALNPNMLYLQSIPMTETMFAASLTGLLWATLYFHDSQSTLAVLFAAAASNAASLTRYEGWFLIPFVTVYFLFIARRKQHAVIFAVLAALGPLSWLAHNQYYYSNALEFYNGEYSAMAIAHRHVPFGIAAYPGDHNWRQAAHYFLEAVKLTAGWPLIILALAGWATALLPSHALGAEDHKPILWPLFLLLLPAIFYTLSIHSSGTPIFMPTLWPHTWYNTRYGLAALPFVAFAAAGIITLVPARWSGAAVAGLAVFALLPWAFSRTVITEQESSVNSVARRAWTSETADYLNKNYVSGSGLIYSFGDLTGAVRASGLYLGEALHDGNHPAWDAAVARPEFFLHEEWALAIDGDKVDQAIHRAQQAGLHYQLRKQVVVKGALPVNIYQRREFERLRPSQLRRLMPAALPAPTQARPQLSARSETDLSKPQ